MTVRTEAACVLGTADDAPVVDEVLERISELVRRRVAEGPTAGSVDAPLADGGSRPGGRRPWSEHDVWVIAYPDHFREDGRSPMAVLGDALDTLAPETNGVHVLPCYPWSSDDGYAVIDPLAIDPAVGSWDDVRALADDRRLMLDAVVNHLSSQSDWFQAFLAGKPRFENAFVTADPDDDLSAVVRPRSLPLLTRFEAADGPRWLWTTFSADQVDVNITDPDMLVRILDVLLAYAEAGAAAIRLDAVAFLHKEPGTSSIHHPRTHAAVRLFRAVLDLAYPEVLLVTETNVPHAENVTYLGANDEREAQLVYQFALPPLVLHTMLTGDATALAAWAAVCFNDEVLRPGRTTFLNFLASHDGIGLRPVEGLLDDDDLARLVAAVRAVGGAVNTRSTPDGDRPYELCTTWFEAVAQGNEDRGVAHHLASHAIMLLLPGVAAVYAHSLLGASNDEDLRRRTGAARSLNRARFDAGEWREFAERERARRVNEGLRELVRVRRSRSAFSPDEPFAVAPTEPGLFRFYRGAGEGRVLVEVNVSTSTVSGLPLGGWRVLPEPT